MITTELIISIYNGINNGEFSDSVLEVLTKKYSTEEALRVSTEKSNIFTRKLKDIIHRFCTQYLDETPDTHDIDLIGIHDSICNVVTRKVFNRHQIVFHYGILLLMTLRLSTAKMHSSITKRLHNNGYDDATPHINEILKLSYCFIVWTYIRGDLHSIDEIIHLLDERDRFELESAIGGSVLFIYLHELCHIRLHTRSDDRDKGNINPHIKEFEADEYSIHCTKNSLKLAMFANIILTFEFVKDLELYALYQTDSHPEIIKRLENLSQKVNGDSNKQLHTDILETIQLGKQLYDDELFSKDRNPQTMEHSEKLLLISKLLPEFAECLNAFKILTELYRTV